MPGLFVFGMTEPDARVAILSGYGLGQQCRPGTRMGSRVEVACLKARGQLNP